MHLVELRKSIVSQNRYQNLTEFIDIQGRNRSVGPCRWPVRNEFAVVALPQREVIAEVLEVKRGIDA